MSFQAITNAAIANVGISFEWIMLIITVLGAMIFFAKDFKIGMMILLVTTGGLFIWFYEAGLNYALPLIVFFMALVILALSLYAVNKSSATGGFT
jgi:hypothetical protein